MQDAQAGRVEVDQAKQITAVLQKRMLQLEQEASQLRKAVAELNQKLGSQVAPQKDKLNPPNVLVKGLVKKVGEDGLLVINIGTDNGLQVGHTLEVFRATPQPKYLGSIQVLDVTPRQAVARPIGAMRIHGIEVGDQVTSKILQERQPRP